jgi:hypothetical protein
MRPKKNLQTCRQIVHLTQLQLDAAEQRLAAAKSAARTADHELAAQEGLVTLAERSWSKALTGDRISMDAAAQWRRQFNTAQAELVDFDARQKTCERVLEEAHAAYSKALLRNDAAAATVKKVQRLWALRLEGAQLAESSDQHTRRWSTR